MEKSHFSMQSRREKKNKRLFRLIFLFFLRMHKIHIENIANTLCTQTQGTHSTNTQKNTFAIAICGNFWTHKFSAKKNLKQKLWDERNGTTMANDKIFEYLLPLLSLFVFPLTHTSDSMQWYGKFKWMIITIISWINWAKCAARDTISQERISHRHKYNRKWFERELQIIIYYVRLLSSFVFIDWIWPNWMTSEYRVLNWIINLFLRGDTCICIFL